MHQNIIAISIIVAILTMVGVFYVDDYHTERLPDVIRIATGKKGGFFYTFSAHYAKYLEKQTGKKVELIETTGTGDNAELLLKNQADVALIAGGTVSMENLYAIAPLYDGVTNVIVRNDSKIESIKDMVGHKIAIGPANSGIHINALTILKSFDVDPSTLLETNRYFSDMLKDKTIEGAIVTTSIFSPDLRKVLATGDFKILPIEKVYAIALDNPFYEPYTIPQDLYKTAPAVPDKPILTLSSITFMACSKDASNVLVLSLMDALYKNYLQWDFPNLIPYSKAKNWSLIPLHPAARSYYNPIDKLDSLTTNVKAFLAFKDMAVALAAVLYIIYARWTSFKKNVHEKDLEGQRELLNQYLNELTKVERIYLKTKDKELLQKSIDDAFELKLKIVEHVTNEEIRATPLFITALYQCHNVIQEIRLKLEKLQI
ncbi:MAG: TAXI family TRAP transporter solute-binding subunit [Candidatus Magnetoovum sp. WYHC-5]|nr:TAXI family TRAP transporter solute-binding subunit [Candidatus Magnetoovum sp. WYHC-5]